MAPIQTDDEARGDAWVINKLTGRPMPDPKAINYLPLFRRIHHIGEDPYTTFIDHAAYSPSLRHDQMHLGRPYDHSHLRRPPRQVHDLGNPGLSRQPKFVLGPEAARSRMRAALAAEHARQSPSREEVPPKRISPEKQAGEDAGQDIGDMREELEEISPSVLKRKRSTRVQRKVQMTITPVVDEIPSEAKDEPEETVTTKPPLGPSALKRKHRPSQRAKASWS